MTCADPLAALHAAFAATLNGSPAPEPTDFSSGHPDRPAHLAPGVLPQVLDAYARDAAARITPSPIPLALAGLVAASGAIREHWSIEGPTGSQPLILWAAIVGEPSTGKSAAVRKPAEPLYDIEAAWAPADEAAMKAWKVQKALYDADFAKAIKAGKTPLEDGLGPCPGRRQILINDGTVEAVAQIEANNPAGCIVALDELKSLLGGFGRYAAKGSSADMEFYLDAWNGKPYRIDRKTSGRTDIPNHALSVIGGIQPDVLRKAFGDGTEDNGFLARFLISSTPPAQGRMPRSGNKAVETAWADTLAALAAAGTGQALRLDDAAWEVFEQFNDRNRLTINDMQQPALWRSHVGKWRDAWLRIAGIVHMIEHASDVRSGKTLPEIGEALAVRVSRFMIEALEPEAATIYFGVMSRTTDRRTGGDLGTITDFILRRGKGRLTWGEVSKDVRALRATAPADGWRLLDTLAEHGWLSSRQGGGKPYWIVNPVVFERFRDRRINLAGQASTPQQSMTARDQADLHAADQGDPDAQMRLARRGFGSKLAEFSREIGPDCEPEMGDRGSEVHACYAGMSADATGRVM